MTTPDLIRRLPSPMWVALPEAAVQQPAHPAQMLPRTRSRKNGGYRSIGGRNTSKLPAQSDSEEGCNEIAVFPCRSPRIIVLVSHMQDYGAEAGKLMI